MVRSRLYSLNIQNEPAQGPAHSSDYEKKLPIWQSQIGSFWYKAVPLLAYNDGRAALAIVVNPFRILDAQAYAAVRCARAEVVD